MESSDLFSIIFNAFSPYMFAIAKLAFATTLFSSGLKILRQRSGMGVGGDHWGSIWTAFLGYLFCRGIPIIIGLADAICDDILSRI